MDPAKPADPTPVTVEGEPLQRPPRAQTEERIEQTIEIVCSHFRDADAVRVVAGRFSLSERQARDYVARAWERIHEQRKATRHLDAEQMIHQFETLADEARDLAGSIEEGRPAALGVAVQAMDRVAKIKGVYAAAKVEHSGTIESDGSDLRKKLKALSDDELAEYIRLNKKLEATADE